MKAPATKYQLLMAISEISTRGRELLKDQQDVINLADTAYRIKRQAAIDWVTEGFEQLSELNRDEAAMFGSPQEAKALDDYPNVSRGRIPMAPLIEFSQGRLERLEQMRRDLGNRSTAETPRRPLASKLKTGFVDNMKTIVRSVIGMIIAGGVLYWVGWV